MVSLGKYLSSFLLLSYLPPLVVIFCYQYLICSTLPLFTLLRLVLLHIDIWLLSNLTRSSFFVLSYLPFPLRTHINFYEPISLIITLNTYYTVRPPLKWKSPAKKPSAHLLESVTAYLFFLWTLLFFLERK